MANYSKLRNELVDDPLGIGYAQMTDAEAAVSLNAKSRTDTVTISSAALLSWSGGGADDAGTGVRSRFERIEANATEHTSRVVRGACKAAVAMIERSDTYLDMSDATHAAMVSALVAGSVLTSGEQDELTAMATKSVSRASELRLGTVLEGYVTKARA